MASQEFSTCNSWFHIYACMVCPSLQPASALNQINVRVGSSRNNNGNSSNYKNENKKKQPQLGRLADSWADVWVDSWAAIPLPPPPWLAWQWNVCLGEDTVKSFSSQFAWGSCRANIFDCASFNKFLSLFLFLFSAAASNVLRPKKKQVTTSPAKGIDTVQ